MTKKEKDINISAVKTAENFVMLDIKLIIIRITIIVLSVVKLLKKG